MSEYRCVSGHDLCHQSYPGPECPYCVRMPEPFTGWLWYVMRALCVIGIHVYGPDTGCPYSVRHNCITCGRGWGGNGIAR